MVAPHEAVLHVPAAGVALEPQTLGYPLVNHCTQTEILAIDLEAPHQVDYVRTVERMEAGGERAARCRHSLAISGLPARGGRSSVWLGHNVGKLAPPKWRLGGDMEGMAWWKCS